MIRLLHEASIAFSQSAATVGGNSFREGSRSRNQLDQKIRLFNSGPPGRQLQLGNSWNLGDGALVITLEAPPGREKDLVAFLEWLARNSPEVLAKWKVLEGTEAPTDAEAEQGPEPTGVDRRRGQEAMVRDLRTEDHSRDEEHRARVDGVESEPEATMSGESNAEEDVQTSRIQMAHAVPEGNQAGPGDRGMRAHPGNGAEAAEVERCVPRASEGNAEIPGRGPALVHPSLVLAPPLEREEFTELLIDSCQAGGIFTDKIGSIAVVVEDPDHVLELLEDPMAGVLDEDGRCILIRPALGDV